MNSFTMQSHRVPAAEEARCGVADSQLAVGMLVAVILLLLDALPSGLAAVRRSACRREVGDASISIGRVMISMRACTMVTQRTM